MATTQNEEDLNHGILGAALGRNQKNLKTGDHGIHGKHGKMQEEMNVMGEGEGLAWDGPERRRCGI